MYETRDGRRAAIRFDFVKGACHAERSKKAENQRTGMTEGRLLGNYPDGVYADIALTADSGSLVDLLRAS